MSHHNGLRQVVLAAALVLGWSTAGGAQGEPLRFLVSNGVKAALVAVAPSCEASTGTKLAADYNTSTALRARAESGAPFDVAFMTVEVIDALATGGAIQPKSRTVVAKSLIGVGVREGAALPDLRTADAVRTALLAASSVTYATDGASRPFIETMFERLGIAAQMKAKTHPEQGSVRATARVVDGQTGMVLTLVSEIVPVAGLRLVGALPSEFQGEVTFAAGVGAKSARAEAARKMIDCLTAPATETAYTKVGLERAHR
ncbi:MAG TPA: substrate-binding domain-containing protein [Vicinamibacterales bacterium]